MVNNKVFWMILLVAVPYLGKSWGFFAHKKINHLAVFTLPEEMIAFYKHHLEFITENAVNPDKRRYVMKNEAPRHYIDTEEYGDSSLYKMPRYWDQAVEVYSEEILYAHGMVPYHIGKLCNYLIRAFKEKNKKQILKISSDLGHYIADANVPLHTTRNYNGQFTKQYGIHGFWESRLPELFYPEYDLLTGKATYIKNLQLYAWKMVILANKSLDSVLSIEKELRKKYLESKLYGYEARGKGVIRTFSYNYSKEYHKRLKGMVERKMKISIKMIGNVWTSCWIKAGQPDLKTLIDEEQMKSEEIEKHDQSIQVQIRDHEVSNINKTHRRPAKFK